VMKHGGCSVCGESVGSCGCGGGMPVSYGSHSHSVGRAYTPGCTSCGH
jgi:hypothetical protein